MPERFAQARRPARADRRQPAVARSRCSSCPRGQERDGQGDAPWPPHYRRRREPATRAPSAAHARAGRSEPPRLKNLRQLVRRRDFELVVAALARSACPGASAGSGGVAEAVALQVVVLHLADALDAQRLPRQVLARAPAALRRRACASIPRSAPAQSRHGWSSSAFLRSGASSCTSCLRVAIVNEDVTPTCCSTPASSYRPSSSEPTASVPALVPAEAGDDAIGGARVLDLDHRALARLVARPTRLGDDAVEAGAFEARRASRRDRAIARHRREVERRLRPRRAASRALRAARPAASPRDVAPPDREHVERDERRRRLACASFATRDAAGCSRICSASKSSPCAVAITISPSSTQPVGSALEQRVVQLGKVAIERPQVAALDVDVVAASEHDRAEAVPLRLVEARRPAAAARRRASRASARRVTRARARRPRRDFGARLADYSARGQKRPYLVSMARSTGASWVRFTFCATETLDDRAASIDGLPQR